MTEIKTEVTNEKEEKKEESKFTKIYSKEHWNIEETETEYVLTPKDPNLFMEITKMVTDFLPESNRNKLIVLGTPSPFGRDFRDLFKEFW